MVGADRKIQYFKPLRVGISGQGACAFLLTELFPRRGSGTSPPANLAPFQSAVKTSFAWLQAGMSFLNTCTSLFGLGTGSYPLCNGSV